MALLAEILLKCMRFNLTEIKRCVGLPENGGYEIREIIGVGCYGSVYAVCVNKTDCKTRIVKVIRKEQLKQEVTMLLVADENIAPILYTSFTCGEYGYLIQERFDMTMERVGRERAQVLLKLEPQTPRRHPVELFVFTLLELERMLDKILELSSSVDVIHGDLKPDNILIKLLNDKLRIGDYGYAGPGAQNAIPNIFPRRGWAPFGNIQAKTTKDRHPPIPQQPIFAKYYNTFQFLQWCVQCQINMVIIMDEQRDGQLFYLTEAVYDRYIPDRKALDVLFQFTYGEKDVPKELTTKQTVAFQKMVSLMTEAFPSLRSDTEKDLKISDEELVKQRLETQLQNEGFLLPVPPGGLNTNSSLDSLNNNPPAPLALPQIPTDVAFPQLVPTEIATILPPTLIKTEEAKLDDGRIKACELDGYVPVQETSIITTKSYQFIKTKKLDNDKVYYFRKRIVPLSSSPPKWRLVAAHKVPLSVFNRLFM